MATATQKHKVVVTYDQTTHESHVTIDGRELPGMRRCDVALRAHDCEIRLVLGDGADVTIEADTQQIETKKEGEAENNTNGPATTATTTTERK